MHPLHVVCTWIGNSTLIAQKHYLQVTDADFKRAAQGAAQALQKALQQAPAPDCTVSQPACAYPQAEAEVIGIAGSSEMPRFSASVGEMAAEVRGMNQYARRDSNPQPTVPKTVALSS